MCVICQSARPFDPTCPYTAQTNTFATILEGETSDAGASTATSYAMAVGDTFLGNLSSAGDRDGVAITLEAGQSYAFGLRTGDGGEGLIDPYLRLYDANGTELAYDDDGGVGRESDLGFTASYTGTYYLEAAAWADNYTGSYELTTAVDNGLSAAGTIDELAYYLTDGYWADNGGSRHAFNVSDAITVYLGDLNADGQRLAQWALQSFEVVADVTFEVVGSAAAALIDFTDTQSGAYAGYSGYGGVTTSAYINVSASWLSSYGTQIDDYNLLTYIHEVGHALGLGHQGDYNGRASYGTDETFANDSYQYSVMSYFSQSENTTVSASLAYPVTQMLVDIVALQDLYGAPDAATSPTAGATVYGVGHSWSGAYAGGTLNTYGAYMAHFFSAWAEGSDPNNYMDGSPGSALTIYDVSGHDRIDFSTDTGNQVIDLRAEGIGSVYGETGNLVIARGTTIEDYIAGSGDDTVTGNDAANLLSGKNGADTLHGGDGDDHLRGGLGADDLRGDGGHDLADYSEATSGLTVDLSFAHLNSGEAEGDQYESIEGAVGSAFRDSLRGDEGDNTLKGEGENDLLFGRGGNDTLEGGNGDDILVGGTGSDVLKGGAGSDRAAYWTAGAKLTADIGYAQFNTGEAVGDTFESIENLQGTDFDDSLRGSAEANKIWGGKGHDYVFGRQGDDVLYGQDGNDVLLGGTGADVIDGGAGIDRAAYWQASSAITVDLTYTIHNTGEAAGDRFISIENLQGTRFDDNLRGSNSANTIWGGNGRDVIHGRNGDDTLNGQNDDDILIGGLGADHLDGGGGTDRAAYWTAGAGLTADLANSSVNTGEAAGDTYTSIENLQGTNFDDILRGDSGANTLFGGSGDDVLEGRLGADTLCGGAGQDTFVFADETGVADLVVDFERGTDVLDVAAWGVYRFEELTLTSTAQGADVYRLSVSNGTNEFLLEALSGNEVASIAASDFLFTLA